MTFRHFQVLALLYFGTLQQATAQSYEWSTFAGLAGSLGSVDDTGAAARFYNPHGVAFDAAGNLYVADMGNHTIRRVSPAGVTSTFAGLAGSTGSTNGSGAAARFHTPHDVAVDASGHVYVADTQNHIIRKVTPAGEVSTLAGSSGTSGSTDGTGAGARFNYPTGIDLDATGNVYVTDFNSHTIRRITPAGVVTTLAGQAGTAGSSDGTGSAARFFNPGEIAVNAAGTLLYVSDYSGHTIRQITAAGVVTTLAGSPGSAGGLDGTGSAARFNTPTGVTVDANGQVYVADTFNHAIRRITPAGVVTTLGGLPGFGGSANGIGLQARFLVPTGVAIGPDGSVYVADLANHRISRGMDRAPLFADKGVVAWGGQPFDSRVSPPPYTAIAAGEYHTVALKGDGTVVAWGDNGTGQTSVPTGLSGVTAIVAGGFHTVALKGDGTVVAWGNNGSGQTTVPAGLSGVTAIAAGASHTVALKEDGTVVAWGNNGYGQSMVPVGLSGVTAIAAGREHSVALKEDRTVIAWGQNHSGQTTIPSGMSNVIGIAAGESHTIALKEDGTVAAWGDNSAGQLNVPAGLSGVASISAGVYHSIALKRDGTVQAWGSNGSGQSTVPSPLGGVTAISAGRYHTVALLAHGQIEAWGWNGSGQTATPKAFSGVTSIAAGYWHSAALKSDGSVVTWGDNGNGQTTVPVGLGGVAAIAAGGYHTVALKGDGRVVAWGSNHFGQTTVPAELSGVTAIAAGYYHTVALKGDGTVVAWGYNFSGQTTVTAGLSGVTAIAAGDYHTVVLKGDGTVVAWGSNLYGQRNVPAGLSGVTAIAAGEGHTVALKGDGSVVAWGWNQFGQMTVPAGLSNVMAIAAGARHTAALKVDGTVITWGVTIPGTPPAGLTSLAAGGYKTVAIIPLPPQVVLGQADTLTTTSAILHGSLQPYGKTTSAQFEYSTDGSFSSSVPITLSPADGTTSQDVSATLTGLMPGTTYRYRITATNTNGTTTTGWLTFTTATDSDIAVRGGGIEIPDGDATPQMSDATDFGHLGTVGTSTEATYTITNAGPETLLLTDTPRVRITGANVADFTVTSQPEASVAPGQSASFTVRFQPGSTGLKTATVNILNTDSDESSYTFAIHGSRGTGVLDGRFSGDGLQSIQFTTSGTPRHSYGQDVAVQPDGKLLVVGYSHNGTSHDTVLVRYLADGTLDSSFGTGGQVRTDFGADDACYTVALQVDGKIVVGGEANTGSSYDFALARYLPNGTLDTSFDGDGKVLTNWFAGSDSIRAVVIQPDGKIIAAGYAGTPTVFNFAVARYNADGSLDSSFGSGGKVNTSIGGSNDHAFSILLQPDGRLVVGGRRGYLAGGNGFGLVRYNANGTIDTSFGTSGFVSTILSSGDDTVYGLALQGDGKIVAAGRSFTNGISYDFGVARYLSNGALDTSFDGDGMRTVGFGSGSDWAQAVEVQPDGKIVLSGFYTEGARQGMGILRLNSNGSYDQSYGPDGIVKITPGPTNDRLFGSMLDTNANLVATGFTTDSGGTSNLAVVRVLAASAPGLPQVTASVAPDWAGLLVSGQVQPAGASTTLTVEYGTTNALGSIVTIVGFTGGGAQSFRTTLYPGNLGISATYYFRVTATSLNGTTVSDIQSFTTPSGPGIRITGNGQAITTGDSTPNTADHTEFVSGTVVGGPQSSRTYTIANPGTSTLNLTGSPKVMLSGAHASDFIVTTPPPASVAAGGSTTFLVTFNPSGLGTRSAVVSITSDAIDFPSFTFAIQGSGELQPAGPGQLDPGFGNNGVSNFSIPGYSMAVANAVAVQPNGKLVVAGLVSNDGNPYIGHMLVARLNTDGTLDTSFDGDGWLVNADGYRARAVAVQSDGKIVVFGLGGLFRYLADGTLDATFSNDPFDNVRVNFAEMGSGFTFFDEADMLIQPDGKIVVYGLVQQSGSFNYRPAIRRFNSNGSVDASFNAGNILPLNLAANADVYPTKLALQPDGKILAVAGRVGGGDSRAFVVRVTPSGALDSFGGGGVFQTNALLGSSLPEMALDAQVMMDGTIVLAGRKPNGTATLLRLSQYGTIDSSFGSSGGLAEGLPSNGGPNLALSLQPDGKPFLGFTGPDGSDIVVSRYTTGGFLDNGSFYSGWLSEVTEDNDQLRDLITDANGNAVIVGVTGGGQMLVARVLTHTAFPPVVALQASSSGSGSVTLNGTVNPRGKATTAAFEYSLFDGFFNAPAGQSASVTVTPNDGTTPQAVSTTLGGLQGGSTYYYRLTATSADGTSHSTTGSFVAPATNADLTSLTLSSGTLSPAFASGTTTYAATVPNATSSVTVTASPADPVASFTLNGSAGVSGSPSAPLNLNVGANVLTMLVTAADASTTKSYTLTITRLTTQQDAFEAAFGSWAGTHSIPAGESHDPDGDGKTNLEEFAFGTNPGSNSSGTDVLGFIGAFAGATLTETGQPTVHVEPSATSGVDRRALFIRRTDHALLGLSYVVEFSANLTDWQASAASPSSLATSGDHELVGVKYPLFVRGRPARFFRVRIIAP